MNPEDFGADPDPFSQWCGRRGGGLPVCAYPENLEETLSVFGEKGTAVIGGVALNTVEMWKFASSLPQDEEVRELRENTVPDLYGTGHNALYGDFINALETKKQPLANGEEAMREPQDRFGRPMNQPENQ